MRVALSTSPAEVRIEERPAPEPGAGEVVARVEACGVCGSDVLDWYVERKVPAVLGHEPVGVVTAVGAGVERVREGDRVAIHHHLPCGRCRRCRRGRETLCEQFRRPGIEPGGFAELVRVGAGLVAGDLLVVPDEIGPAAASLTEPLACVLRAQRAARLGPGETLLVLGAGSMGLLHVAAARAAGVAEVLAWDPRPERLAAAAGAGAEALAAGEPEAVAARLGGRLADVVMVATSSPAAVAGAPELAEPGGTVCLYAPLRPGTALGMDGERLFFREVTVASSYSAGPADMRAALDLIAAGAIDTEALVTHRLPLAETARALELARTGAEGALKVVVEPGR